MSRQNSVLARLETFLPAIHRYRSAGQAGKRPEPADARAQEEFLNTLRALLMGFARRYLRDFDSITRDTFVQDLVSTVLLTLPDVHRTLSDPPLGAWLWAVTRHAAANLRRRRRRQLKSRPLSNTIPACSESPRRGSSGRRKSDSFDTRSHKCKPRSLRGTIRC
jgi:DNA-directed RNA polymerase specialized sigma24 family protein